MSGFFIDLSTLLVSTAGVVARPIFVTVLRVRVLDRYLGLLLCVVR